MRAHALDIVARGFAIFPVYERAAAGRCGCGDPACRNVAKHPATRNGLRDATRSPLAIEKWWRSRPWNIGIATGSPAIVLDVDPRHGGDESLAELEAKHGPLPITWRAFTGGGGEHVYLAPPAGRTIPNSANKLGPGLDIRGHGGYVVAPPSVHSSGREYAWNVEGHPDEVPLAPMPEWLVEMCAAPAGATAARFDATGFVGAEIVEGGRNAKLTSLTGHLLRRYVEPKRPRWTLNDEGGHEIIVTSPGRGHCLIDHSDKNVAHLKDLIAREHEPDPEDAGCRKALYGRRARKTLAKIEDWQSEVRRRKNRAGLTKAEAAEEAARTAAYAHRDAMFAIEASTFRELAHQAAILELDDFSQERAEELLKRLTDLAGVTPYGLA